MNERILQSTTVTLLLSYLASMAVLLVLWRILHCQSTRKNHQGNGSSLTNATAAAAAARRNPRFCQFQRTPCLRLITLTLVLWASQSTILIPSSLLVHAIPTSTAAQDSSSSSSSSSSLSAEPSPSFLEQLMQSLTKFRSGSSQDTETSSNNSPYNNKASHSHTNQQHPSNTYQTDSQQPGLGLTFQHARRLSLYQVSLFQHYKRIWKQHTDDHNNKNAETNINTTQLQFAIESAYQHYLYGFNLEPSMALLLHGQELDATSSPNSQQKSNLLSNYYSSMARRQSAFPPLPQSMRESRLEDLHDLFTQAWDAYLYHAFPAGEVAPLSCRPREFSLVPLPALTLIDGLDTLLILGNTTEFARSVERLRQIPNIFHQNQNVSVFETTIRVLGGLLSAHQMAEAWLPQVVIWQKEVFVMESDDEDGTDNAHDAVLDAMRTVRTGRDDATEAATCSADTTSTTATEENSRDETLHHREPLHRTASFSAPLSEQHQHTTILSVSLNKHQQATSVWKNNTQTKQRLNPQDLWSYDGFLLDLAKDIGDRLLPAFSTATGIPYGTVHLQTGVPHGETPVASLAGGGTLVMEMELLSQLTGDEVYGRVAKRAARSLWIRQTALYLMGKHIDTQSGSWTETLSGIGSNSDSYYEYLAKHYFVFYQDADFFTMFASLYTGIFLELRRGDWYVDSDMNAGARVAGRKVLESLMAFFPGLQILVGEHAPAARSLNAFFVAREYLGFLPERFQFESWRVDHGGGAGKHPLRPELLESAYLLNQAIPKSRWEWGSEFALQKLQDLTPAPCGFASLADVKPHTTGSPQPLSESGKTNVKRYDEMPSFFLSETLKYLYLTFDYQNNMLHKDALHRDWIFTTEAHPIHLPPTQQENAEDTLVVLQDLLHQRLDKRKKKNAEDRVSEQIQKQRTELWSDQRQIDEYVTMFKHVQDRQEQSFQSTIDPFFGYGAILQYAYGSHHANDAHMIFAPLGLEDGWKLINACPNFHASDLMFVHAMHGDSLDYTPRFATTLQDKDSLGDKLGSSLGDLDAAPFVSTARAMAMWGSDYFQPTTKEHSSMLKHFDESLQQTCLLPHKFQPLAETKEASAAPRLKETTSDLENNPGFTEISTEMGTFQVTAFDGGSGFGVVHLETGHELISTFVKDRPDSPDGFVMVHALFPGTFGIEPAKVWVQNEWKIVDENVASRTFDRSMVMSDMRGNAFRCDVELVQFDALTQEEIAVVVQYPCTNALFGPSSIASLVSKEQDELIVTAPIVLPSYEDPFGCDRKSESEGDEIEIENNGQKVPLEVLNEAVGLDAPETTCANTVVQTVQLVHRGECSFIEKALNQKYNQRAEGVIVINNADDEVFIMSYGQEDLSILEERLPATVLINGSHGSALMEVAGLAEEMIDSNTFLSARITVRRQSVVDEDGEDDEDEDEELLPKDENESQNDSAHTDVPNREEEEEPTEVLFPVVNASPTALRVLAKGGWGIQAVSQVEDSVTNWHLQLMHHELGD